MTWKLHVKSLSTLLKLEPQLETADERTLSLYLPVHAEGFDAGHYDLILNHVAADYARNLDPKQRPILNSEMLRVRTHLKVIRPAGVPALVAFSNEALGLLTLIRLPESVEPRVEVGPPLLAPLELILLHHPPALVVVVDKQDARIYASVLGEVVQLDHLAGLDVRHTRAGGTSASSNQRKADNRTRTNLKHAVEVLEREIRRGEFERIFVAGPDQARSQLVHELPKLIAEKLAGTISATLDSKPGKLIGDIREQMVRAGTAAGRDQP